MTANIKDFPDYTIDTIGIIRKGEKVINSYDNNRGYLKAFLYDRNGKRKSVRIHRLVAEAFLDNPYNLPVVNHIDGNKHNNAVDNLEWVSHRENTRQSLEHHSPTVKPIAQINPKNGSVKGVFLSMKNCSDNLGLDYRGLFEAVKQGIVYKGYLWKYCTLQISFNDATPPQLFSRGRAYV
jgi:hypothetical protein